MGFGIESDPDKLLSFYTRKQVNIRDRYLGLTQCGLQAIMGLYIVFGVLLHGYLEVSESQGATATHVKGDALAVSSGASKTRYFSAEEITYPGLENGNVFVATRQTIRHQKRGTCLDMNKVCSTDGDCSTGGTCDQTAERCNEPSWCAQGDPEVYELGVSELQIWVKSSIQFVMRDKTTALYSTDKNKPYPEKLYNIFSVRELLMMCTPVPVRYEEIAELGAAIEVQFIWNCNVQRDKCEPIVRAKRLDVLFDPQNIGFKFSHAEYTAPDERIVHEKRGVRIFLRTVGRGEQASMSALIMKTATTTSLLTIAEVVADLMLIHVFTKGKKFRARKFEKSPDFSEYMDRLHMRQEEQAKNPQNMNDDDREAMAREANWMRRVNEED